MPLARLDRDLVDEDLRPADVRSGHDRARAEEKGERDAIPSRGGPRSGTSSTYRSHGPVSTSTSRTRARRGRKRPATSAPSRGRGRPGASARRDSTGSRSCGAVAQGAEVEGQTVVAAGRRVEVDAQAPCPRDRRGRARRTRRSRPATGPRPRPRTAISVPSAINRPRTASPGAEGGAGNRARGLRESRTWLSSEVGRSRPAGAAERHTGIGTAVNRGVDYGLRYPGLLLQSLGLGCRAPRPLSVALEGGNGRSGRENEEKHAISNKVFVGNLSFDVSREELIEAFSAAGKVVDAKVPTDRETGTPARLCLRGVRGRRGGPEVHIPHERQGPQGPSAARERSGEPTAASRRWRRSLPSVGPSFRSRPAVRAVVAARWGLRRLRPRRPSLQGEGEPPQHPSPQARIRLDTPSASSAPALAERGKIRARPRARTPGSTILESGRRSGSLTAVPLHAWPAVAATGSGSAPTESRGA